MARHAVATNAIQSSSTGDRLKAARDDLETIRQAISEAETRSATATSPEDLIHADAELILLRRALPERAAAVLSRA